MTIEVIMNPACVLPVADSVKKHEMDCACPDTKDAFTVLSSGETGMIEMSREGEVPAKANIVAKATIQGVDVSVHMP